MIVQNTNYDFLNKIAPVYISKVHADIICRDKNPSTQMKKKTKKILIVAILDLQHC